MSELDNSLTIERALKGLFDAESKLRTHEGVTSPAYMSEQMMRLAQYAGAVEEHLAKLEQDHEERLSGLMGESLRKGKSATFADRAARVVLGPEKGNIIYLNRIVSSAWKQVGVVQSRYNHINKEIAGQS